MTRSERCFHILSIDIGLRSRTAVFDCQLNRHVNVNDHSREQEQTDYPKQRAEVTKVLRVTIDPVGTEKICKLPSKCPTTKRIKMTPVMATIIFFPTDER